jgi:pimeloyl-ACP methyl ester carboxylesterase
MTRTNVPSLSSPPTIVLVHGALTDASVWHDVAAMLLEDGHPVTAPALPMRDLESDVTHLAAVIERIEGPVVLVAHSYAGAVISHPRIAACGNVTGLVFIAAFQPDEDEAAGALNEKFPGTLLTPENLEITSNPIGGNDLILRPDRFAEVYAADVDPSRVRVMAVSQRPIDPTALGTSLPGTPSWRSIPSWALVTTADRSLPPAILRFMADRAGSETTEVDASHAVPVSRPQIVTELILRAARASTRSSQEPTTH